MTTPRTELFLHLNGIYDGADIPVEVDEDGVPVEFHVMQGVGSSDNAINPAFAFQAPMLRHTYERDVRMDGAGVQYVFVYRGTDSIDPAA